MQLTCPACSAVYEVPDSAIGANGRRVRCRACQASWFEPPRLPVDAGPAAPPVPPVRTEGPIAQPVATPPAIAAPPASRPRRRVPWMLVLLGLAVVGLGALAATVAFGPGAVADRLGLAGQRVPLGIAITREPDWRLIAGGSQLFAVSGRIWNPTQETQPVPDLRVELHDRAGHRVYAWTITRPVAALAPGAAATFDGAAVDVPASSAKVSIGFASAGGR